MTMPLLSVNGVSVRFGGLRAVDNVDFTVGRGEIVGLIGPNGAGKTTTFNSLCGVVHTSSGSITFDGSDITGLPPEQAAKRGIARTFQNVRLFGELSLRDNVMMGAYRSGATGALASLVRFGAYNRHERRSAEQADRWLEALGLSDHANTPATVLPFGLQRVAEIARAMASEPLLVLLDEPAAGLNEMEKHRLVVLLKKIVQDTSCSILLVEHNMPLVMGLVDRIVVLDFGRKIAEGSPDEIARNPAVIEAYLGA